MKKFILFLKGVLMGACDVIPGVSGGTIAFITGIYDELLDALHSLNFKSLKILLQGKFKLFRETIHGNFLLLVFGGIVIAILSLAKLIDFALANYPVLVRAFFFGLIISSAILLKKSIKNPKRFLLFRLVLGTGFGLAITLLPIMQSGTGNLNIFLSGVIAIIAMVLPGVSGSYILVVLGQYQNILGSVVSATEGDTKAMLSLLIFIIGAVIGLILFAKLLHYIKTRRHDQMMVVLIGFMIGSLNKVRPWKETLETFVDRHGEIQPLVQKNIIPSSGDQILLAIGCAVLGLGVVIGVHWLGEKLKTKS